MKQDVAVLPSSVRLNADETKLPQHLSSRQERILRPDVVKPDE